MGRRAEPTNVLIQSASFYYFPGQPRPTLVTLPTQAWSAEAAQGEAQFREIEDPAMAREHLGVLARMLRVDRCR